MITRTGLYQNYNLSVSGGTKKYNYFASFGYHNNQGIVICSGLERYTGRFNASYELFKWLRFGLNFSYEYRNNDNNKVAIGGVNYWNGAIFLNPIQKPTDTVNVLWGTGFDGGQPYNSPYMDAHLLTNQATRKLCSISPNINITLAKGLTFRSRFNYYVFQYATGYSAAIALSQKILSGEEGAVEKYLNFLSSGCSKPPIELLKDAGVDMTTAAPVDQALELFGTLLDELEALMED